MSKNNIVCLRHPSYQGSGNPDLDCLICCEAYVRELKLKKVQNYLDITQWLESKSSKETLTWTI